MFYVINAEDDVDKMSKIASSSEMASTSKTPRSKARVMSRRTTKLSESFAEGDEISAARTGRTTENRLATSMSRRTQVSRYRVQQITFFFLQFPIWFDCSRNTFGSTLPNCLDFLFRII